jgi:DNA polymerase-1
MQLKNSINYHVEKIKETLGKEYKTTESYLCFSAKENFRKKVYSEYKAHRNSNKKPLGYGHLLEYAKNNYRCESIFELEADDVLGMLATLHGSSEDFTTVIASIDKDMETLPCYSYNMDKEKITHVNLEDANYNFYTQVLTGDPVDNYGGCPGIGKVTADKLLNEYHGSDEDLWQTIVETYEQKGLTEDDALVQARCARILRFEDYDFEKGEPILWEPKIVTVNQ